MLRAFEVVLEINQVVYQAMRPGVTCAEVYNAAERAYERLGYGGYLPGRIDAPVVHMGYRYASDALIDAQPELPSTDVGLVFDGAPGSRLPHVWLERDGRPCRTDR
jgi:Xaa-Pro aminopeptidase